MAQRFYGASVLVIRFSVGQTPRTTQPGHKKGGDIRWSYGALWDEIKAVGVESKEEVGNSENKP
jgi:hypothetical protein